MFDDMRGQRNEMSSGRSRRLSDNQKYSNKEALSKENLDRLNDRASSLNEKRRNNSQPALMFVEDD